MARSLAILALWLAPIAGLAQAGEESHEHDRQAIIAHLDEIYEFSLAVGAIEELTARQLQFYASLPSILPPGQEPIVGREAVADFYQEIFASIQILENSYAQLTIEIQGKTAVRRYVGSGKFRNSDDAEVEKAASQITDVLIKEKGKWKTLVHTWRPLGEPGT